MEQVYTLISNAEGSVSLCWRMIFADSHDSKAGTCLKTHGSKFALCYIIRHTKIQLGAEIKELRFIGVVEE